MSYLKPKPVKHSHKNIMDCILPGGLSGKVLLICANILVATFQGLFTQKPQWDIRMLHVLPTMLYKVLGDVIESTAEW